MQNRKNEKYGTGRALHRKQLTGLRATFEVLPELPAEARHGLFGVPQKYDAWVRLSNGGFNSAPDKVPDIRGFSIKVLGVTGRGALGGTAPSQDFALINHSKFSSPTSDVFTKVVTAGASGPGEILRRVVREPRLVPKVVAVAGALKAPFDGFATHDFHSAAPIACGPYAVRVRVLKASDQPRPEANEDWAADVYARLPLSHEVQLQFFTDEASTPIEDASVDWPTPYLTVARLNIPAQQRDDAFDAEVEAARFDPWNALVEHRPLGEVMRARKVAYFASQQNRAAK
ncbi:hypothetical protein [Kribbella deserti]